MIQQTTNAKNTKDTGNMMSNKHVASMKKINKKNVKLVKKSQLLISSSSL
jgi:hypothetical protein